MKLTNKEIEFIEIALNKENNFKWASLNTSTIKKLYKMYKNYMKLVFEKDDLEIKIDKAIKYLKLSSPAHWSNENELELLKILNED